MFETMIIGAGPGGTGALLWAARAGLLAPWLERGAAIVDRRACMGGTIGRYALNADTAANTFLECLDGVKDHPALAAEVGQQPRSRFLPYTDVHALRLQADGSVVAEVARGSGPRRLLQATSAVLALG